ncbi:MAG: hypothetical protein ACRD2L_23425, partial [Terriglobia bacterium]
MDSIAKPVSSPADIPRTAKFIIPRNTVSTFDLNTRGGVERVQFSFTLPAGVPASAFTMIEEGVPAPDAKGRLRFNGCDSCPASFIISVRARDPMASYSAQVELSLTSSSGRPRIIGIKRDGGTEIEPRFEIGFAAGTFDPRDSQAVATYPGGLKYRLIPGPDSRIVQGRLQITVPRLKVERGVTVTLVNPYGSSNGQDIQLPVQLQEVIDGSDSFQPD